MPFLNKVKKISIISLIALAVLLTGLFGLVYLAGEKLEDINFLTKLIKKSTGLTLEAEKVQTDYSFFTVKIKADKFNLKEEGKKPFIALEDAYFRVNLSYLVLRKIKIENISAKSLEINIERQKDGTFDFMKYFKSKNGFLKADLSSIAVEIPNYKINVSDLITNNKFSIQGNKFSTLGLDINKKFKLETEGNFVVSSQNSIIKSPYLIDIDYKKNKGKIELNKQEVVISSFDLSFIKDYFTKFGFKKFDGIFDIYSTATNKNTFKIYLYTKKIDIAFNYKNDLNTIIANKPVVLEVDFGFLNNDLNIKKGSFLGEGYEIDFAGNIKNLFGKKKPEFDFDLEFLDVDVQKLVQIVPDTVIPLQEEYIKNLKTQNANGIVNGKIKIDFKGKKSYSVFGKLDFQDVYVVERPKNAKTSFGTCEFKGRDVLIDVFANAPNGAILTVFGKTKMEKMPYCEFKINSHGKLDMEFAHKVLIPVQKILNLKLGPLPYMTLKGTGEIDLLTKGTKEKSNLEGWFKTDNATVTMEGVNAILNKGVVKVDFKGDKILFNNATGYISGAKTLFNGVCDVLGNIDINVFVNDVKASDAIKIAQTSYFVTNALDGGEFLKSFKPTSGNIDFNLNISGNVPPDAVFGEPSDNVLAKGKIDFKGVNLTIDPKIKGENVKGSLTFENNAIFDLTADIFNSPFEIKGKVEQKGAKNKIIKGVPSNLEISFLSNKLKSESVGQFIVDNIELFVPQNRAFAKNLAQIFKTNKFLLKGKIKAQGPVYSNASTLDLSGFDFSGTVEGINAKDSDFAFKGGKITLNGKNAKFENLRISASGVDFLADGNINNFASLKPYNNLKFIFYNSSFLSYFNIFKKALPVKIQSALNNYSDISGSVSGSLKLTGDKIEGSFVPNGISLTDSKTKEKVHLKSGKVRLKNDKTYVDAFNLEYGGLPLYVDGFMQTSGSVNPEFNFLISSNITEEKCDKIINPLLKYPVMLDGEVSIKGRIQGKADSYTTYLNATLNEASDLTFMGVKLGDSEFQREISSKIKFKGNYANVDYIKYLKYLTSNRGRKVPYDILKITGGVNLNKNMLGFNNLKITTPSPAPVRFLNILFKKSVIKDGVFTANVTLNGNEKNILAVGNLLFSQVSIPLYNSVIESIKIELLKNKGKAEFELFAFDTLGSFTVEFLNKLTPPFVIENVSAHSDVVSTDNLIKAFSTLADTTSKATGASVNTVQSSGVSPSDIVIKKGALTADKIYFNKVEANDFKMNFTNAKDSSLNINDAYISIAGGLIKGQGVFKFNTKDITLNADFINCDANELTKAFLNLSGQIYGNANGAISLSMKNFTPNDYLNKINANTEFEISKGRMPKLGSIEYLLKASNLIKSGVFGLTLNNVIEVLTPYKRGDFNKISGNFKISESKIRDLKLYSQGEELSTYTYGSYDIPSGISDIEILGKLSKKVSTLLGPIGNTSVVSILNLVTRNKVDELMKSEIMKNVNKIPLINLNSDDYRLFNVKLKGKINADDVVKSFTWLN